MLSAAPTTAADDRELLRSAAVTAGIHRLGIFPQGPQDLDQGECLARQRGGYRPRQVPQLGPADGPPRLWLAERRKRRQPGSAEPPARLRGRSDRRDARLHPRRRQLDSVAGRGPRTAWRSPAWSTRRCATRCMTPRSATAPGSTASRWARQRHPGRTAPLIPAPGAVHQELQAAGLDYSRGPFFPSLAYQLVQVACGGLDAAVSRRGARDWDVAGAACILSEAGVSFEDVCIGALRFNRPETRHGALAALCEPSLKAPLHAALVKVYGCPQPQEVDLERLKP